MNSEISLEDTFIPTAEWHICTGSQMRKLIEAGLIWLEKNHQHVNALNVFPVPDGDTGTNMLLTMKSAYKRVSASRETDIDKVMQNVSQGALMGARGNSGVILSQFWRGLAQGFTDKGTITATDLANAMGDAQTAAYGGVMNPVEGTILTVIREACEEAQIAAENNSDLRGLMEKTVARAQMSLNNTPNLLPVLKQAGVVDSGGQGLFYILEGMLRAINGLSVGSLNDSVNGETNGNLPAQARAVPEGGSLENPYDVQFILQGSNLDVLEIRKTIDAMGDSTVVVGDENTIKVHVHVQDPGQPLSYGVTLGHIMDVVVENMQEQMEEIVRGGTKQTHAAHQSSHTLSQDDIGVVVVTPGQGLSQVFHDLGAAYIVAGGQTNNPSTEEIYEAIERVPTNKVIVLPNNKNIQMAADSARDLSDKQVIVIPTRTIPQGVAALLAYSSQGDLETVAQIMEHASSEVASGKITTATRTVALNGISIEEGNIIGIANEKICVAGNSWQEVLPTTLAEMGLDERELVSVYYGEDVSQHEAEIFGEEIEMLYPEIEVEIVSGGQAHYFFILGAE